MTTKIEWADEVWNPVIGCSKVSDGCKNCYAERQAARLTNIGVPGYEKVTDIFGREHPESYWTGKTAFVESALEKPLRWKKPRRIFVCSMGDLFHESVSIKWFHEIYRIMESCQQHTFMLLTKRPAIAADFLERHMGRSWPLPNVWLGTTVETQDQEWRIKELLKIQAAVQFVSVEPMLGPVDLEPHLQYPPFHENHKMTFELSDWSGLDWVICGGESGPGARPMHPDWARGLRDQCQAAGVPFFFKQWGEYCHPEQMTEETYRDVDVTYNLAGHGDYEKPWKVGKKKAGRLLDEDVWNEMPETSPSLGLI